MARSAGASKPAAKTRPDKATKAATRAAKRAKRRETWTNLRQAFTLTRENDSKLLPYMLGGGSACSSSCTSSGT